MLVVPVPNRQGASAVFAGWRERCAVATSPNGWVVVEWWLGGGRAEAWVEWSRLFCAWIETFRSKQNSPDQKVILFLDRGPRRGKLEALSIAGNTM